MAESSTLGLIAGDGRLPAEIASRTRHRGRRVHAIGFRDLTDPALEGEVDTLHWLELGRLDELITDFRSAGIREALLAGKVSKEFLFRRRGEIRPDARALAALAAMGDRSDDAILGMLAEVLQGEGVTLLSQLDAAPELVVGEGPLGKHHPTAEQRLDLELGWRIAKALGDVDVGQTAVVKDRAVLALEAIEGTDAAIERGAQLGGRGVCVVKVAKPGQDLRFDVPVVGPRTMETLRSVGAAVLACEAGGTLVVDREASIRIADEGGIVVWGIGIDSPAGAVASIGGDEER